MLETFKVDLVMNLQFFLDKWGS